MKKTFILKYLLLMISLTFLYTTPAFASAGAIVGSVDVFNGTQISGWAYETASPLSSPDILLKITNTVTGETVSEIPAKPVYSSSAAPPLLSAGCSYCIR